MKLEAIKRSYAPDMIQNAETLQHVASCADSNLTALFAAAPDMYELIQSLASTWLDDCQFIPSDTEAAWALSNKLARLAAQASQLLVKIEGGGE